MDQLLRDGRTYLHVPALCDVEVASAMRRAVRSRLISIERVAQAIEDYVDLPISRHGHQKLLVRIVDLRENFSAYDATYVALAEALGATLLTEDSSLARAARAHTAVETISS